MENKKIQPESTLEGLWSDIDVSDEELEEITHPQRVIARLKAENEALRREVQFRGGTLPEPEASSPVDTNE